MNTVRYISKALGIYLAFLAQTLIFENIKIFSCSPDILITAIIICAVSSDYMKAAALGFDFIGTTLAGYTEYTKGVKVPPYSMIKHLIHNSGKPVIAEGNISTPEMLRHAMDMGSWAVVVGSAITRPLEITKKFMAALED